MSYWLELHCDQLIEPADGVVRLASHCATNRNDNVTGGASNRMEDAENRLRSLRRYALASGWTYSRRHGWACPNCTKWIKENGRPE